MSGLDERAFCADTGTLEHSLECRAQWVGANPVVAALARAIAKTSELPTGSSIREGRAGVRR